MKVGNAKKKPEIFSAHCSVATAFLDPSFFYPNFVAQKASHYNDKTGSANIWTYISRTGSLLLFNQVVYRKSKWTHQSATFADCIYCQSGHSPSVSLSCSDARQTWMQHRGWSSLMSL
ncbi:XXYS1_4_G0011500.mRNA.1.CDS.1 [Saccharomyces cerevisiae]|nr:XXYS1_4_G0011500.mRNA.1.CDS.1 [Saccharomyces cerevisiae]